MKVRIGDGPGGLRVREKVVELRPAPTCFTCVNARFGPTTWCVLFKEMIIDERESGRTCAQDGAYEPSGD